MDLPRIVRRDDPLDFDGHNDDNCREVPIFRLRKRYIRDARNPFEWWADNEFIKRYRFSKHAVMHVILPQIVPAILHNSNRGLPLAPVRKLLLCLRFYATASYQIVCGDIDSVSQASTSNIVKEVSRIIAHLHVQHIKFPATAAAKAANREQFVLLGRVGGVDGIPGIDGAIDCTHIKIVDTPGRHHGEAYRNRKTFFSINVQAVMGPSMEFLDIVARWAGSTHDSRIFQMSRVNMRYVEGQLTGSLLGDNGYPALRHLLTPLLNPLTKADRLYNRAHIKARNIIERGFGVWKRRFPCLRRGLGNALPTVSNIIVACAVLHNIAVAGNEDLPDDADDAIEHFVPVGHVQARVGEGHAVRQAIILAHFAHGALGDDPDLLE
ncbi:putative nuclease HARBI1 [Bacillus rossius redtenbacheri]|uniref:putative nuclease HARBI1 n=1 Tax=Bacillus rossius redtenbacheri TaxID=93214 RepID=UPI002FDE094D